MDGKEMEKVILERFNIITGRNDNTVDLEKMTSAQKARFISWVKENNFSFEDIENESLKISKIQTSNKYDKNISEKINREVGIDIQFISELFPKDSLDLKSDPELLKVFSLNEIAFAETKLDPLTSLAGIFAAKEAILKAGYNGEGRENLCKLEISHDKMGKPFYQGYSLSISHSNEYSIAVAVNNEIDLRDTPKLSSVAESSNNNVDTSKSDKIIQNTSGFSKLATIIMIVVVSYFFSYFEEILMMVKQIFS